MPRTTAGSYDNCMCIFKENTELFPRVAIPFHIHTRFLKIFSLIVLSLYLAILHSSNTTNLSSDFDDLNLSTGIAF